MPEARSQKPEIRSQKGRGGVVGSLVLALLAVSTAVGHAQPHYGYYQRPTVSPYLNLARRGNLAVNYYGLVQPQRQLNLLQNRYRTDSQRIRAELFDTRRALQSREGIEPPQRDRDPLEITPSSRTQSPRRYFFNQSRYYPQ